MMYHVSWGHLRYLLTCKVLGKTRVMTEKCFLWRTRVVYLVARPSVLRGLRLDGVSCILTWFPCKSLGETRVTARKSFMWRTCVVYLIVRPSVGRKLIKTRWCFMYLHYSLAFKALGETRVTTRKMFLVKNLCCLLNCKAFGGSTVETR